MTLRRTLSMGLLLAAVALLALPSLAAATTVKAYTYGGGTVEVFKHASWELQYRCDGGIATPTGHNGAICEKDGFLFSNAVSISARPYSGYRFAGYQAPGNTCVGRTDQVCEATAWGVGTMTVYAHFVDDEAPDTNLIERPAARTSSRSADMRITTTQVGSTFRCRLDGGAWYECAANVPLRDLADGPHRLEARAIDPSGNVDATPDAWDWIVDTVGPTTTFTTSPPPFGRTAVQVSFASEAGARHECMIQRSAVAGHWTHCSSPLRIEPIQDGIHSVSVRSFDTLNNAGGIATRSWTHDTQSPSITLSDAPAEGSTSVRRTFTMQVSVADANAAQLTCAVDDGAASVCGGSFAVHDLADGAHVLQLRAEDAAGNVATLVRRFHVDATAPLPRIVSGPGDGAITVERHAQFAFVADEPDAQLSCSINGADFTACTSPYLLRDLPVGRTTFRITARDRHGNELAPTSAVTRTWTISAPQPRPVDDSNAPLPAPNSPDGNPAVPTGPSLTADRTPPALSVRAGARLRVTARVRFLALTARCSEACTLRATGSARIGTARVSLAAAPVRLTTSTRTVKLVIPARLRTALRRTGRGTAVVTLVATDAAGNRTSRTVRVQLSR